MSYTAYGIDYTGGLPAATIDRATIDGHQIGFVCRYLSDYPSKNLTASEARDLSAAGLNIVVFWENGATDAEQGYTAGVRNAKRALELARACGMPAGRPILMCVDEDTAVGPHVRAYFQGAGSVLGRGARGVYGSYAIVKDLFDEDLVDFAMQTYAWSGGRWDSRAQLQQYSNDHTIAGAGVDYDRATAKDYGQWRVGVTPTPSPKPPEEHEVISGSISAGKGPKPGIELAEGGPFHKIKVGVDNTRENKALGVPREGPAQIRLAMHQPGRKGTAKDVTVGATLNDTKGWADSVIIPLPAGCDRIDVERSDDGTRPVTFCVY